MKPALLLTCEHGGNRVPARYRDALAGASRALLSHRGQDPGSLQLARQLARALDAPLVACTTTRLLVDTNRSLGNRGLFSEWTRPLPAAERDALVDALWRPHRAAVDAALARLGRRGRTVLHVGVHSFTPRFRGRVRPIDVALLYDPARRRERSFADAFLGALAERRPDLRLARNRPYRGTADGLTTHLRRTHPAHAYLGVELEVSQRFPLGPEPPWRALRGDLLAVLRDTLDG